MRPRFRAVLDVMFASSAALVPNAACTVAAGKPADTRPNLFLAMADNWAWPHAGAYKDKVVKTPVFDRIAAEGVLFTHTFCVSPSCSPARVAFLTGRTIHQLEDGGNLWGILPKKFEVYPDLLEAAGYYVGYTGKGWGPGSLEGSDGRTRNPAGPTFQNFEEFLKGRPEGKPFCFLLSLRDPHRSYVKGSGAQSGMKLEDVIVPPGLPDTPEVRGDMLDYYLAVQRFDRDTGEALKLLEKSGQKDNTLVMMFSDNGWQFPRGLANVYDTGTRVPLAVRWPGKVKAGGQVDEFVSFTDFAPTFLEIAGLKLLPEMSGRSFRGLLQGEKATGRDQVFLERERHANVRQGDLSYPCRALRNKQFLYIRNLRPELWPAGDPELHMAVGPYGDVDASPTKELILAQRDNRELAPFFQLGFAKRPAEELYDLTKDPGQVKNVAALRDYVDTKKTLRAELDRWMKETSDPRAIRANDDRWDRYPYFGPSKKKDPGTK